MTLDPIYRGEVVTWTLNSVRHMEVMDDLPSRTETQVNSLAVSKSMARIRMRYFVGLDSSMRIVLNRPTKRVYQIVTQPAIIGSKDYLEVMAELVT